MHFVGSGNSAQIGSPADGFGAGLSAAWIEAPLSLSEFVQGAMTDHPTFERVGGSETRVYRPNPARVG